MARCFLCWSGDTASIERKILRLYVPITSAILVSVALSLVVWLLRRF